MDADFIIRKAKRSLSDFCINECKAYCCRKGYLIMNSRQVSKFSGKKRDLLIKEGVLRDVGLGRFSFHLGNDSIVCPNLKDFKCKIHKSKLRPKACDDFPIFFEGNTIRISLGCPAVAAGRLYPFVKRLRVMGYRVIEGNLTDSFSEKN